MPAAAAAAAEDTPFVVESVVRAHAAHHLSRAVTSVTQITRRDRRIADARGQHEDRRRTRATTETVE
jgi:hypothetical protein